MKEKIRLGILGTGRIAKRFVPETRTVESVEIVAVCNPHIDSARKFAEEFGVGLATEQLEQMVDKVDAVYIATPHQTHYAYAKELLQRGIHVLCEKPMTFSGQQAKELFALAKDQHCVLMEGIKTAYCPGFKSLLEVVADGQIGTVHDVEACFSRLTEGDVRELTDARYGGSFTEFGTYTLLPIVKLLGTGNKGRDFWSLRSENGLDMYTKGSFDYGTAMGLTKTGLTVKSEGQLVIAGSKGYILAQSPWWLTRHFEVRYEDPNKKDIYDFSFEGQGLRYEIQAFADKINGKLDKDAGVTSEESIWFAEQMEHFCEQR